ncbi:MAG: SDR family oxidoreductase [Sphaerochaetaceae bacterium]
MRTADFVLITGAGRRIGRSLALAVASSGSDVALHYLNSEREALSLKEAIEKMGRKALLIKADLSKGEEVERIIPSVLQEGSLKALINNASIFENLDWQATNAERWHNTLDINLTAPYLLSRAFAHHCETGSIINMLDWRSLRPDKNNLAYSVSKGALYTLTQLLAEALAPQIRVNAMALGAILPPEGKRKGKLGNVPAGRWGTLEEVNATLLFLLNGPAYITGEIIHLDGGRHLT